jgi:PEP-CTERM motif
MFDSSNRIGMAASLSDVAGGPETLYAVDLDRIAIPEPSSLLLMGSGLLGFAAFVRRRRLASN